MTLIKVDENIFKLDTNEFYSIMSLEESTYDKETQNILLDKINLILSKNKFLSTDSISSIIQSVFIDKKDTCDDYMNVFEDNIIKYKLNKKELLENYNKCISKSTYNLSKIPKELLLNEKQLYQLILNEIEKVNSNMSHEHYIVCNNNNILDLSIRIRYNSGNLVSIMNSYNYDYFELSFKLDRLYPFIPPKVNYIKPHIDISVIHSITHMDIWKLANWNYMYPLDSLIMSMSRAFEPLFIKYIDTKNDIMDSIHLKIFELCKQSYDNIVLDINVQKLSTMGHTKEQYWKSGTGFGSGDKGKSWDISMYIDEKNINTLNTINCINELAGEMSKIENYTNPLLNNYIVTMFTGINVLDINNSHGLYNSLVNLVMCLLKSLPLDIIQKILDSTKDLYDELSHIIQDITSVTSGDNSIDVYINTYIFFIEMINMIKTIRPIDVIQDISCIISDDIKIKYKDMINKEQFGNFTFNEKHRFYKHRSEVTDRKSMLRIVSEISSFRKNLPNNWDSSVIMRINKLNVNMISFVIIGPKDTPYHNGIFEFHAYLPNGYPSTIPQVLINTTGGGKVRFNPNLYACGKVCLSLLGTWSGEQGESWNSELSTFLQVIISIQSLIMVEKPYFNEPGYERTMNNPIGIEASRNYNDTIRLNTIKVAMIDNIKNKISSFENLTVEHFKYKKEEIINTVSTWIDESLIKDEMKNAAMELFELLNTL